MIGTRQSIALSHTLGHTPRPCHSLGFSIRLGHTLTVGLSSTVRIYSENKHAAPLPALASIASHTQRPSKARFRPAKARKSPRLCDALGHTQKRAVGPLNAPSDSVANPPQQARAGLDHTLGIVLNAPEHTRARACVRTACYARVREGIRGHRRALDRTGSLAYAI